MVGSVDKNIDRAVARLIRKIGIKDLFERSPIYHGGNNRAWVLETKQGRFFLKEYFVSEYDKRDRFGTEIAFSLFAWEKGIRTIPEPLAADRVNHLGLFSFIPGRRPEKEEINVTFLEYALEFLKKLNVNKESLRSQVLPHASESCVSIAGHIETVEKKIGCLKTIKNDDVLNTEALDFVQDELLAQWQKIKLQIQKEISEKGLDLKGGIRQYEMILSPSDFGYHNTILTDRGELFFIDFEYAGWDDPAKLICDFFSQPELPVSIDYFDWFVESISEICGRQNDGKDNLLLRAKLLFPLYRLKWCCIMLNDFIPMDQYRKNFASYNTDRRKIQLDKAAKYLKEKDYGIY